MVTHGDRRVAAIRRSRRHATSGQPERWAGALPSLGRCDVGSFVLREHLGGVLVLGEVRVGGEPTGHHDGNRIDRIDLDLTAEPFAGAVEIREIAVVTGEEIPAKRSSVRAELADRIALLGRRVGVELGATSA